MSDRVVYSFADVAGGAVPLADAMACHPDMKTLYLLTAPVALPALSERGMEQLAVQAAGETGAAVFADLGPAPDTAEVPAGQVYTGVAKQFAALGARNFLFETLSSDAGLLDAVGAIKAEVPDAFVLVSFAVLPDGYTREGMYCKDLARRMQEKLWKALYYRYDFAKEYRPQLEENLLWLDGELKKLEGMQMRHRIIEKSDR